ncbi:hypothetical protein R3P38DRAFT_2474394, partial [Favolaschia claudopus]
TTMTAEQANVLARGARMRRQILLDRAPDMAVDAMASLSELEMKAKVNLSLTLMTDKLEGAVFVGARRLQNGGVIVDCKDDKTAERVKKPEVMKQFLEALGSTCVYKPRYIDLVAERIPVETDVADTGTWRVVEADSGISAGGIAGERWIKAQNRRMTGQTVAHIMLSFTDADAANHAIDNGIFLKGRHYQVRKSQEEARRCAKCQKYDGHLAFNCKSAEDVCGRC